MAAHKFVISFSFGVELRESSTRAALHVLYIGAFALMSVLGISIGIVISEAATEGGAYTASTATCNGLYPVRKKK